MAFSAFINSLKICMVLSCIATMLPISSFQLISQPIESKCSEFEMCSQICDKVDGNLQCSCVEGYRFKSDNKTCAPHEWSLLVTIEDSIVLFSGTADNFTNISEPQIVKSNTRAVFRSVTSDVRNNVVYWTEVFGGQQRVYKMNIGGIVKPDIVVDSGTLIPTGLEFDWITGNVYFMDSMWGYIAVCAPNLNKCAKVIQGPISTIPCGLALHPNEGIMFWTTRGKIVAINRANMDGSNANKIVSKNLIWPFDITVDAKNSRIYWTNAGHQIIESSRFDGSDRKSITQAEYPFGIEIFGDMLFWTESVYNNQIMFVNKSGGPNTLLSNLENPKGINAMHISKQPILRTNACKSLNCSNVCALSASMASCLCPVGLLKSGNDCVDDNKKIRLLLAQHNTLLVTRITAVGKNMFDRVELPSIVKSINALVYNPTNDTIIISDGISKKIFECKLKPQVCNTLVEKDVGNITLMDFDAVSENLFWYDAEKRTVEVMSLRTATRKITMVNVTNVYDILFVPNYGALYISQAVHVGKYEVHKIIFGRCATTNFSLVYKFSNTTEKIHLTYFSRDNTVVTAFGNDAHVTLQSVPSTGYYRHFRLSSGSPINDVVQINSQLFWVDLTETVKMFFTAGDNEKFVQSFSVNIHENMIHSSPKILAIANNNDSNLRSNRRFHECSPVNFDGKTCSHICMPIQSQLSGECWCPNHLVLDYDGLNCVKPNNSTIKYNCLEILQNKSSNRSDIMRNAIKVIANTTRLIFETTNTSVITKTKTMDSNQTLEMAYVVLKDDVSNDICWSMIVDKSVEPMDLDCGSIFGITALSLILPQDDLLNIKHLKKVKMTNTTIYTLMEMQETLIYRLILLLREPANIDMSDKIVCLCEIASFHLYDYLVDDLKLVQDKRSLPLKLGLEYHENQIDCCLESKNFKVLGIVDTVIVQWELSPLSNIFSYGLFSERLEEIMLKNQKLVSKYNSNCTIFIRILYNEAEIYGKEINNKYKALLVQYIKAWSDENKGNEIFILKIYQMEVKLPKDIETLQNHISPMLTQQYANGPLTIKNECSGLRDGFSCTNQYILSTISSTFKNINIIFSNHLSNPLCAMLLKCNNESNITSQQSLGVVLEYKDSKDHIFLQKLVENGRAMNFRTIYLSNWNSSWNETAWNNLAKSMHSKNTQLGCFISFQGDSKDDDSEKTLSEEIAESCGSLFNLSSKVICHWLTTADLFQQLPTFFLNFEEQLRIFQKDYPDKMLIPALTLKDEIFDTKDYSENSVSSFYCDSNVKRLNEYYEGILSFVGIHKWTNLHLRSLIDDGTNSGWWRKVKPDENYINRLTKQFPVLARTNAAKTLRNDERVPLTYPCVTWTTKATKYGIPFLKNQYSGATVDMSIKDSSSLKPGELETMLLFAFGKFPTIQLIVSNKLNTDVVTLVLTENLLEVVRKQNYTIVYMEMSIGLASETENFDHLFETMAVHYTNWEKYDKKTIFRKFSLSFKNNKLKKGLFVSNCENEISTNLTTLLKFPLLSKISYIVCNVKPITPINHDRSRMQKYLDAMFYTKTYIEHFLPIYTKAKENFEVYFQLNFESEYDCYKIKTRQDVDDFLRFLNDVNQYSSAHKLRYFVKSFQHKKISDICPGSWWKLNSYEDLTNSSVYVDRENEHFDRPTLLEFQLPRIILKRENVEQAADVSLIVIISVVSVLLFCAVIALWYSLQRMRTRYLTEKEMNEFYDGHNENSEEDSVKSKWLGMAFPKSYEVAKSSIEFGRLIGSGEFGQVFIGMLTREHEIAIKVPKPNGSKEVFKGALMELKILLYVGDGQHPNIVLFMGAYTREIEKGKLYIVTEYCKNGSLQNYLRGRQMESRDAMNGAVNLYELYRFSYEISLGMEFISEKKVIHGDLSTRNVFLDTYFTCKIGDFGLSRKLYEYTEYMKKSDDPLPWRWMAVESLKHMEFTTKSDVWSFGITLWEIFSLGVLPYPGLAWSTSFVNELENGMRMEKATYASEKIHEILLRCWSASADERPTFKELAEVFGDQRRNEYTRL